MQPMGFVLNRCTRGWCHGRFQHEQCYINSSTTWTWIAELHEQCWTWYSAIAVPRKIWIKIKASDDLCHYVGLWTVARGLWPLWWFCWRVVRASIDRGHELQGGSNMNCQISRFIYAQTSTTPELLFRVHNLHSCESHIANTTLVCSAAVAEILA